MTDHHDRDTVVVRDSGSSLGTILGAVLVIALLVAVWYFTLGPGAGGATDTDTNDNPVPSVEIMPSEAPPAS